MHARVTIPLAAVLILVTAAVATAQVPSYTPDVTPWSAYRLELEGPTTRDPWPYETVNLDHIPTNEGLWDGTTVHLVHGPDPDEDPQPGETLTVVLNRKKLPAVALYTSASAVQSLLGQRGFEMGELFTPFGDDACFPPPKTGCNLNWKFFAWRDWSPQAELKAGETIDVIVTQPAPPPPKTLLILTVATLAIAGISLFLLGLILARINKFLLLPPREGGPPGGG